MLHSAITDYLWSTCHAMLSHAKFQDVGTLISRCILEGLPILVTHACKNNWLKLLKKLLPVRREKKGEKTRSRLRFQRLHAEPPPISQLPNRFNSHKCFLIVEILVLQTLTWPHMCHVIKVSYGFKDRNLSL